jgi:hypothetical protein
LGLSAAIGVASAVIGVKVFSFSNAPR